MYIKAIDIENFGNFSKTHFDFSNTINSIIQENGYGKSTICAFIKAMFYGLDERGRKSKTVIFERERYFPWTKQKYGGSLIFEFKDKDYKVIRFFDEKKSEKDTFELYDEQTKKKILSLQDDFNLSNGTVEQESLGQQVFGINKESFERSCFVNLDALKVPALNDDISGKLNNILEAEDDIGNFENAKNKITSQIRHLSGTSKTARINLIDEEIKEIKNQIIDITSIESTLPKLEKIIQDENAKIEEFKNQLSKLELEKNNVVLYEQKKLFEDKKNQLSKDENVIEQLNTYFNNSIPTQQIIQQIKDTNNEYIQSQKEIENNNVTDVQKDTFNELQKFFYPNVPTLQQLEDQQRLLNTKKQIEQNASNFQLQVVQKIGELENQKNQIEQEVNKIENQKNDFAKNNSIKKIVTICLSILSTVVFLLLGIFLLNNKVFSIVFFSCSILSIVLGLVLKPKNRFSSEEKLKNLQENLKQCVDQILALKSKSLKEQNENLELKSVEDSLKIFIAEYKQKCNTDDVDEILLILRKKLSIYDELSKTIPRYDSAKQKYAQCKENILSWLKEYKTNKTLSFEKQIDELQTNFLIYKNKIDDIELKKNDIQEFEQSHNMQQILESKKTDKSSEQLQNEIKNIQLDMQQLLVNIKSYQEDLEQKYAKVDRKVDLENFLSQKQSEKSEIEQRVLILQKTLVLLEKSKETLSLKYMGKMQSAFFKYLKLVDDKKNISIDSDLNVCVEGYGSLYDINYLSEGYKDLVNFCTRLALVDAMFENEKPLIVLDDPFINLDKEKIKNALEVVKQVSEEKQVIYFTCHESRNI